MHINITVVTGILVCIVIGKVVKIVVCKVIASKVVVSKVIAGKVVVGKIVVDKVLVGIVKGVVFGIVVGGALLWHSKFIVFKYGYESGHSNTLLKHIFFLFLNQ